MKSIGYADSRPIDAPDSLFAFEQDVPQAKGRDLLVRVKAVSVNPVDTKIRMRQQGTRAEPVVLGWDVAGIVEAAGPDATLFRPGDEVFYAGSIVRPGGNAEYHLVDERIVGRKPASLSFVAAAALPLTSLTAWESLFDRLGIPLGKRATQDALLIVGGSGGVGSIATQLARRLTGLTVIATASRPETKAWVESLGAHHVIDHNRPLSDEIARLGGPSVRYVFSTTQTHTHYAEIVKLIAPQGRFCLIDDPPAGAIDVTALKGKSVALCWESMFTRSTFQTDDMIAQHRILDEVARLVDDGLIRSTLKEDFGPLTVENLKRAHAVVESGRSIGKIVLSVG